MTTKKELESLARTVNRVLGIKDPDLAYSIEYAYGRPRLMREKGSRDVSPRLSSGQLKVWIWAYVDGITAAQNVERNRTVREAGH